MRKKKQTDIREKLECHRRAMKEYNDLVSQDKKLSDWVYELDKLYWRTQVCEKKNEKKS
tara:strand:+ start:875 stop:1051 length:177 start_codon:yes stop_codon:yes gene_type:complete